MSHKPKEVTPRLLVDSAAARADFEAALLRALDFVPARVGRVQRLIDLRVSRAAEEWCVSLADHWREGDTGELRCGHGDDVGECESYCPIEELNRQGLISVQVFEKCTTCSGDDEHYGECPRS